MMQLVLIILTKRKATVAKDHDKRFYRSTVIEPLREGVRRQD
jgi:hypothetical protein